MDLLYRVKTLWAALRGNHYTWPAIDITLPGNRHFHLIGSIHMGSHDMAPLPTRLLKKLKNADALIVEADVSTSDTPFANLPTCEALEERINEEQLQNLQHISQEMGISPSLFSTQPLWQIAMVLQATQAQKLGLRAEYGIDYQLLQAAKQQHKPVIELEGAENQIAMLLQLPDKGLALLDDTLTHWHTNARLLQQMMSWWLNAPPQNNDITLPNTFSQSLYDVLTHWHTNARLLQQMMSWWLNAPPQNNDITLPNTFSQSLYDVLMHQRNLAWRDKLRAMPPGRYVVAVGALHLYGEGNLPQMLR
ncbi:TraB/GumN family protein [Escherichia coli]